MKIPPKAWLILLISIAFAATAIAVCGPIMRESDQASLLKGSWMLSQGASPFRPAFYNYDKQFFSYWIEAAFLSKHPSPVNSTEARSLLLHSNLSALAILLAGASLFLRQVLRKVQAHSFETMVVWTAFLFSPCLLLSAPLASTPIISLGFLLALAGALLSKSGWKSYLLIGLLAFATTGARSDAILLFPLLIWSIFEKSNGHRFWFWNGKAIAVGVGTLLALGTGLAISQQSATLFFGGFFQWQITSAYLAFGLGGAALLPLLIFPRLRSAGQRWDSIFSLLLASMPLAFYSAQLYSPRHLILTSAGFMFLFLLPRGQQMLTELKQQRPVWTASIATTILLATIVPLFAGLHLPTPSLPSLTLGSSTKYPTTDGHWPMGNYSQFLLQLSSADEIPIDHNQQTWIALETAQWPEDQQLSILSTPMRDFIDLHARWNGKSPTFVGEGVHPLPDQAVVVDRRSLITSISGHVHRKNHRYTQWIKNLRTLEKRPLSPKIAEQQILLLSENHHEEMANTPAPSDLFGGDEYRLERVLESQLTIPLNRMLGHNVILASTKPFRLKNAIAEAPDANSPFYHLLIPGKETASSKDALKVTAETQVNVWVSVLPHYMSRRSLASSR